MSLELGGSPAFPKNVGPEPRHVVGDWGSRGKDQLENELHRTLRRCAMERYADRGAACDRDGLGCLRTSSTPGRPA